MRSTVLAVLHRWNWSLELFYRVQWPALLRYHIFLIGECDYKNNYAKSSTFFCVDCERITYTTLRMLTFGLVTMIYLYLQTMWVVQDIVIICVLPVLNHLLPKKRRIISNSEERRNFTSLIKILLSYY
jgi:hypothetical protein